MATDEGPGPSGWGILHDRSAFNEEGPDLYMFGPVPSHDMATAMQQVMPCDCKTSVIPMFFPPGLMMVWHVPDMEAAPVH